MIEILSLEKLPQPYCCCGGDCFILMVENEEVHRQYITGVKLITHWALIKLGESSLGYLIGDESLVADLTKLQEISNVHR